MMDFLLLSLVASHGILVLLWSACWLAGASFSEKSIAWCSRFVHLFNVFAAAVVVMPFFLREQRSFILHGGHWFSVGSYHFSLALYMDRLNLPLILLSTILLGLIGSFSVRYLHKEEGFFRFFLLLHLFGFGSTMAFCAASFDLLLGGWELVGLSSVLLVGFFRDRAQPVENGLRVFASYRLADLGLLLGIFVLHAWGKGADLDQLLLGNWPHQQSTLPPGVAFALGLLFLVAASGKSAQLPFSAWLVRSMEGPTPSSAIFYGAISVHMGAYLLLRIQPVLAQSPLAAGLVGVVGLATAAHATLAHRVSSDVKSSLAYATLTQIGIIFVEIALGWPTLALAHLLGHSILRTAQFLRAPSMLFDYHQIHAAAGGQLDKTGAHFEMILPAGMRQWLYALGLQASCLDAGIDRVLVSPVVQLSRCVASFDPSASPVGAAPNKPVKGSLDAR